MKKFIVLAVLMTSSAWAAESRVLLKDSKVLDVEVNTDTVICSAKGYGLEELKINIKGLDGWTILDHSNLRFGDNSGLPCMTAGACKLPWNENSKDFSIDDIIQSNPRVEKVEVFRELTEARRLVRTQAGDQSNDPLRCEKSLIEKLRAVIGGVTFNHARATATTEVLPNEACKF